LLAHLPTIPIISLLRHAKITWMGSKKKHPWMRLFSDSFDNTHPGTAQKYHKFWFINKSSQPLFEQLVRSTTNHQTARSLGKTTKELTRRSKATVSRKRPPGSMWFRKLSSLSNIT
jgi:hypothetical protein